MNITIEEAIGIIHTNFNLTNQGISLIEFEDMYNKAFKYNGALTTTALFAACIKIQGAIYQNSDLLIDVKNKVQAQNDLLLNIVDNIKNGTDIDDNLVTAIETPLNEQMITNVITTREIVIKDFINTLLTIIDQACNPDYV